ncbi:MAG TPA: tRNA (N6-threonylcarbamoyladenosine(37)-N6)-methyltransferase TrmO [candidate division Zixibacteria bacterium]|nr:tRNA (N6-threonylcarbamoyladenosine(37)-N6)-methyltransferase TrmO [candidate division Zixibacteria bacterium]
MDSIILQPIAFVHSTRTALEDDNWDAEDAYIELTDQFGVEALLGLEEFSHAEIVFSFHRADPERIETGSRHPRGNIDWPKVGIFAQRGKNRPNHLGLAVVKIERVEGRRIYVRGLDAIDGTPVLDIKPWVREFGPRGEIVQPQWMSELMARYW